MQFCGPSSLPLATHQVMKKSNKLLDWLVTLSFPIYIFHLTPCIVLSAVLIGMGLSQFQVVGGVVLGAFCDQRGSLLSSYKIHTFKLDHSGI